VSCLLHHLQKTNPSTNRVRLLGGLSFSAYCQQLTSLSGCRCYRPDHSFFGKFITPRFSFASKFSAFLPPFSGPRPVCCIFSCSRCSAISPANWLMLSMIPSNRSLMSVYLPEGRRKCRAVAEIFSRWHPWGLLTGAVSNLSELPPNFGSEF